MSDNGEHTLFITKTQGRGFGNNTPITFNPFCQINGKFIFAVKNPDTKYSKYVWVCATTLNANGAQFYQMVNEKRVALATRIHRICDDEIQSHHAPYNLDAGKSVNKNEIIEYFKNKPCTGFFFTAELSGDSLVLVDCNL